MVWSTPEKRSADDSRWSEKPYFVLQFTVFQPSAQQFEIGPRRQDQINVATTDRGELLAPQQSIYCVVQANLLPIQRDPTPHSVMQDDVDPRLQRQKRQQIIKAARENSMMVALEVIYYPYNNIGAILDGHTTIEHSLPFVNYYADLVQLIALSGTSLTPTLQLGTGEIPGENYIYQTERPWNDPKVKTYIQHTMGYYNPLPSGASAPPYSQGMISVRMDNKYWNTGLFSTVRSLTKLDKAGVVVNAGGHGQLQGLGVHWEMVFLLS